MARLSGSMLVLVVGMVAVSVGAAPATERDARRALERRIPEVQFVNIPLIDAIDHLRDVSGANIHVNWRALELIGVARDTVVHVRLNQVPLATVLRMVLQDASEFGLLTYYIDDGIITITTREMADNLLITRVYMIEDLLIEVPDFYAPFGITQMGGAAGRGRAGRGGGGGQFGGGQIGGGQFGGGFGGGGGFGSGVGGGGGFGAGGAGGSLRSGEARTKAERAEEIVELIRDTVYPDIWREYGGPASIRYFQGHLIVTAPRAVHEALGGIR